MTVQTPDPSLSLVALADQRYDAGDWSSALMLYRGLCTNHPALALAHGAPVALGHCLLELRDDADPTALARDLVPSVSAPARAPRIGRLRVRALELCRSGDYARAWRVLQFLSSFDFTVQSTFMEGFLKGRSGCWEGGDDAAPGFLSEDDWSDAQIAAVKERFRGTKVLAITPWMFPYGPGDRYPRTGNEFGLEVRALDQQEWISGATPAGVVARLARVMAEFEPDVVLYLSVAELGFDPVVRAALMDGMNATFHDARRRRGLRVAASFSDPWLLPPERVIEGLGSTTDVVVHHHPLLLQHPRLRDPRVFCFPAPHRLAPTSVPAGSIPRACMVGSINFATPARIVWWAQAGQSDLPITAVETAYYGEQRASPEGYTEVLRAHQLTINITRRASGVCINTGRSFEVPLAGGVLLEENSVDTRYFLKPGVHYMPFETWTDLTELVPRLLGDPALRQRMARDGRRWVERHFTGDWYWAGLLDRLYPGTVAPERR